MSLIRRAAESLSTRGANSGAPWGDSTPPPPSYSGAAGGSAIGVNQSNAPSVAAVYGCVGLLADSVSSLPLECRSGPVRASSDPRPLPALLRQPYAELTLVDWMVQAIWSLALRGNFLGEIIERDGYGYPVQIKPLEPDRVNIRRDRYSGQIVYRYDGRVMPTDNVFHIRYQQFPGAIAGLNPIQVCGLQFGLAMAMELYASSFFANGADPRGVIEVPGPLDPPEAKAMARSWASAHQGINQAHLPAVLTDDAKFKPITISPHDAQMIEALGFTEQQICGRIFRVPPHMIGIQERQTSFGRGIEQQERNFVTNTLIGYLTRVQSALTTCIPRNQFALFDVRERLRGTILERAQASALLMNSGVGVADDLREWFDWAPLPDGMGQQSFVPINTELLDAAMNALAEGGDQADGDGEPAGNGGTPSAQAARALITEMARRRMG